MIPGHEPPDGRLGSPGHAVASTTTRASDRHDVRGAPRWSTGGHATTAAVSLHDSPRWVTRTARSTRMSEAMMLEDTSLRALRCGLVVSTSGDVAHHREALVMGTDPAMHETDARRIHPA